MSEVDIKNRSMLHLSRHLDCKIFTNPCGNGWVGRHIDTSSRGILLAPGARRMIYGLHPGSPDAVGWRTMYVTESWVGHKVALFLGVEFKSPGGHRRPEQKRFLKQLREDGGLCGFADSPGAAEEIAIRLPWQWGGQWP